MKYKRSLPALALMATFGLSLSACGGSPSTTAPSVEAVPASATPTPTPTAMSNEEAGKFYLAAVCPGNIQGDKTTAVVQTKPFDLQVARAEASALRDTYRVAIETISDEKVLWPEAVKSDVAALADGMYEDLGVAQNLANQTTQANFAAVWNGWVLPPDRAATAQKIRLKLGLSPDTSSSCVK